jgi:flagellar biogenesis protein FliO
MEQISEFVSLGQYGMAGVLLAAIALSAFCAWMLYKLSSNHIEHNTQSNLDLAKTLERLATIIDAKIK